MFLSPPTPYNLQVWIFLSPLLFFPCIVHLSFGWLELLNTYECWCASVFKPKRSFIKISFNISDLSVISFDDDQVWIRSRLEALIEKTKALEKLTTCSVLLNHLWLCRTQWRLLVRLWQLIYSLEIYILFNLNLDGPL